MTENGPRSPRFRRVIFWVIAPFAAFAVVTLPLALEIRTPAGLAAVAAIAVALTLLLLALWDPNRFLWAARTLAAMIFASYVAYVGWALVRANKGPEKAGHRARNSVIPAVGGLILIGWPALMFTLFGRFSLRPTIDDAVTPISPDDPLWVAARQKARETIPLLQELQLQYKGEIAVKFPFRTDNEETEHLWGRLLDLRGSDMWVTVLTPPASHRGTPPQHLKIPLQDLEDWQLALPDGKIRGGFSTKAQIEIYRRDRRVIPRSARKIEGDFIDA